MFLFCLFFQNQVHNFFLFFIYIKGYSGPLICLRIYGIWFCSIFLQKSINVEDICNEKFQLSKSIVLQKLIPIHVGASVNLLQKYDSTTEVTYIT